MLKRSLWLILLIPIFFGFSSFIDSKDWGYVRDVTYGIGHNDSINCSAVKIASDQLLTAAHCVTNTEGIVAFDVFDGKKHVGTAMVVRVSNASDLALLYIVQGVPGKYAFVASPEALRDEIVVAVGYPLGFNIEVATEGVLQGLEEAPDGIHYLISSAPVTFGNSGGGIFVYRWGSGWSLIGIASSVANEGWGPYNHLSFYVTTKEIKEFLSGTEKAPERPGDKKAAQPLQP